VVTDSGLMQTDAYRLMTQTMDALFTDSWHVFSGVHPNPLEDDAYQGSAAYAEHNCDAILALGGGSAMDGAKAIVLSIGAPGKTLAEIPLSELPELIVPLCAIPTTAGTGSEVGQSTVVTLASHGRKAVLGCKALLPQMAILDPELTVGLPPGLTAATGMDAMTHAIESFVCPVFHPMCDGIALEAIYRVNQYLPRAVENGGDLQARGEMLVAASMGAVAFQKDLGAAHSLAHPLSTEFGVHHGLANALVLPSVIRFNGEVDSAQYRRVAIALDLIPGADPAEQVAQHIEALNRSLGIDKRLRDVVPDESALPKLANKAVQDGCHLTNPRPCKEADLLDLYKKSW